MALSRPAVNECDNVARQTGFVFINSLADKILTGKQVTCLYYKCLEKRVFIKMEKLVPVCYSILCAIPLVYLIRKYFAGGVCKSQNRLGKKIVVITGGTAGIGKESAEELARRGAKVIITGRNAEKGQKTVREINSRIGNNNTTFMFLDLTSFQSVVGFVNKFKQEEKHLHVLINNAGVFFQPRSVTTDGFETIFQVNYLSHFLLTLLLLDILKDSTPSRIINVSSKVHKNCKGINYRDINAETWYKHIPVYAHSKLATQLFTRTLSHRLKDTEVSVFSLHPGVVDTDICANVPGLGPGLLRFICWPIIKLVYKTPVQGAQTTVYCAVTDNLKSGGYFSDCTEAEPFLHAENDEEGSALWEASLKMVQPYMKSLSVTSLQ